MPPHNGLFLGQPQPAAAPMTLAQPFNDVQMVAFLAATLTASYSGSSAYDAFEAVEDATELLVESFRQRKKLTDGIQAVLKAEAKADLDAR